MTRKKGIQSIEDTRLTPFLHPDADGEAAVTLKLQAELLARGWI